MLFVSNLLDAQTYISSQDVAIEFMDNFTKKEKYNSKKLFDELGTKEEFKAELAQLEDAFKATNAYKLEKKGLQVSADRKTAYEYFKFKMKPLCSSWVMQIR